jgi:molybdopterin converting factor small subunit
MQVQVRILPWFSDLLVPGQHAPLLLEEELPPGASLRTLLTSLAGRYARFEDALYSPLHDTLQPTVVITYNGRFVAPVEALDLTLQAGDSVVLIPAYSGG